MNQFVPIAENPLMAINFDISVSYDEKEKTGGEAKITVISFLSGNLTKGNEVTNTNISRIKFTVNMKFNSDKITEI